MKSLQKEIMENAKTHSKLFNHLTGNYYFLNLLPVMHYYYAYFRLSIYALNQNDDSLLKAVKENFIKSVTAHKVQRTVHHYPTQEDNHQLNIRLILLNIFLHIWN